VRSQYSVLFTYLRITCSARRQVDVSFEVFILTRGHSLTKLRAAVIDSDDGPVIVLVKLPQEVKFLLNEVSCGVIATQGSRRAVGLGKVIAVLKIVFGFKNATGDDGYETEQESINQEGVKEGQESCL
jgi:hypothetical protein